MTIIINIDVMLAKRKMSVTELSERVGITMANLSILKNGKAKAARFSTLEAICKTLDCQPGDILEYKRRIHSIKTNNNFLQPMGLDCKIKMKG
ncbi:helix-turn-helix domain-containing protein [Bacillus mycoides]|uniref:helix-turn-helix domain-containing protein n=1 Tax=Bacillus mycoides TaxID=1405 RepID=UPI003D1E8E3D